MKKIKHTLGRFDTLTVVIISLIFVLILELSFGLVYLNNRFGLVNRFTTYLRPAPKIDYAFKPAGGRTGFFLENNNRRTNGFAVLLSETSKPNIPSGRFEVEGSSLDFSLTETTGFDRFTRETTGGRDKVIWKDAKPNTDVTYIVTDSGLKEDLILKTNQNARDALTKRERYLINFDLIATNARPRSGLSGRLEPVFFDTITNEYRFHLEPISIIDANGVRFDAASYSLRPITGIALTNRGAARTILERLITPIYAQITPQVTQKYQLTLELPREWLTDPARAYPVVVDPTITHNTQSQFATGILNRIIDTGSGETTPQLTIKYKELSADPATIGLWHLNEASGNVADSSGNGNTGTVTGTTVVAGKIGNARSFTGGDDIALGNLTLVDKLENLTVEAWVYPTAQTASTHFRLFSENLVLYVGQYGNQVSFYMGDGAAWTANTVTGGTLPINEWSHVAWVKQGTTATIYINGVLSQTFAAPATLGTTSGNNYISTYDGTNQPWAGYIDELRISSIARSAEEIRQDASRLPYAVYTSPILDLTRALSWTNLTWTGKGIRTAATADAETAVSTNSLLAQWKFNETSGTTAASNGSCGATCNAALTSFANTSAQDAAVLSGWTANNRRWGAGALMFDNTDDYAITTYNSAQNPTGSAITVEAWVNSVGLAALDRIIGTATSNTGYRLRIDDASASNLEFYIGDGSGYHYCAKAHNMDQGSWYQVAATYDGSAFNLYVNGVNIGSCADAFTPNWGTAAVVIGGAPEYWNGTIDVTRVYGRALTAAEIQANYQAGQIEFQTTSSSNGTSFEAYKPTTGETQINSLNADAANWAADTTNPASGGITKADDSSLKIEGTGSLKLTTGVAQVDANTMGLWRFEETTGTGAYLQDSSANNNDGTPTGTGVTDGYFGKARSFAGAGNYVSIPDAATLDGSRIMTWSAWFKLNSAGNRVIMMKHIGTSEYAQFAITTSSTQIKCLQSSSGTAWETLIQVALPSLNAWHHIACVNDGANAYMYLDGDLAGTDAAEATSLAASTAALNIGFGRVASADTYFDGVIDEVSVDNVGRSAEEIAEIYRSGRDHHLTKTIASTDFSSVTSAPFYIAADQPGTYLQTTIGESDYAIYKPDANTIGYWTLDEESGTGAFLKDISGNAINGTPSNSTPRQGKIGRARAFNGSSSGINMGDTAAVDFAAGNFSIEAWVRRNASGVAHSIVSKDNASARQFSLTFLADNTISFGYFKAGEVLVRLVSDATITDTAWHHIVGQRNGDSFDIYFDGVLVKSGTSTGTHGTMQATNASLMIGRNQYAASENWFNGDIDEVRISNTARSANDIRQAYEVGRRSHPITIDFVTSPQAAYSSGTTVTINNPSGTANLTDTLAVGDVIIFRENKNGTETISSATVASITNTSSVYGTVTLTGAPSFPSGGYTTDARIFKWQREFFDTTAPLSAHKNAITRINLRVLSGGKAANIWLDDLRRSTGYIADNTANSFTTSTGVGTYSSTSITSTLNRYFRYRAIMRGNSYSSPQLTSAALNYVSNNTPAAPTISQPTNGATNVNLAPAIVMSTTDADNDTLTYKLEMATNSGFTQNLTTYEQSSDSTGWTNQSAQTVTSFASGETATYTLQTDLSPGVTYYIRAYAIDVVTGAVYSSASSTRSFTTINLTAPTANPATNVESNTFTANWSAVAAAESYRLDVSSNSNFSSYVTGYQNRTVNTTSEVLSIDLSTGQTYYYRVRAISGVNTSANSSVITARLGLCAPPMSGNFTVSSSCRFNTTVDGVEQGNMTIAAGSTLTINANQQVGWNPGQQIIIQDGAAIAIASGGQLKQGNLWLQDVDRDGYASSTTQVISTAAPNANYVRRYSISHLLFTDADDTRPEGYLSRPLVDPVDGSTTWNSSDSNAGVIVTDTTDTLRGSGSLYVTMQSATLGEGVDGACSVTSGTKNINTSSCSGRATADAVNFSVTANTASGQNQITLASTPTGLVANDEILIINLQGTNAGTYETARIAFISSNTLTLNKNLTNSYNGASEKIMVQRVPNYSSISISSGATLTSDTFSCSTFRGGVIFIRALGSVTVDGTVDANGKGYPGGAAGLSQAIGSRGINNSSCSNVVSTSQLNGGGGGGDRDLAPPYNGGGGGGGGYAASGSNGSQGSTAPGGAAGTSYGVANLTTLLFGGAGGGGGNGNQAAGAGGAGGGIIFISGNSITVNASTGLIRANGANGSPGTALTYCGGGGGAGAGGSIRLNAPTTSLGTNRVTASSGTGGSGAVGTQSTCGGGGSASQGRIRCDNTGGNCSGTSPSPNTNVLPSASNTNVMMQRTLASNLDLSNFGHISIWVKSSAAGANILQFGMGEAAATEQTFNITINAADTWEEKVFDISAIATTSRDAIRYIQMKYLGTNNISFRINAFTYYE